VSELFGQQKPQELQCEARAKVEGTNLTKTCTGRATHVYGPECERTTGKLMYVCQDHATFVQLWMASHANDPVECPTHGRIGKVKSYIVLSELPRA
jgi:hypothetical protein